MSGWVRVENTMPENLKIAPRTDRAFRLWMHALCYCSRAQTDGVVPAAVVTTLSVSASKRVVEELVEAGLFEVVPAGYRVHDYLDHNPSRSRIAELKEGAKKRTARWRNGDGDEDVTHHTTDDVTHNVQRSRDLPLPIPSLEVEVFSYWQERCGKPRAKFTPERRKKIKARLAEKFTVEDIKLGIDGAAKSPFVDATGKRHDDLELICRTGSKLEDFMDRANVVPMRSQPARNADAWRRHYTGGEAS